MKKLLSLVLALCLCAALTVPAMAENRGAYVLMNIPYADFYAAEADVAVDAVTSATLMKPRAGALAGGSYHVDPRVATSPASSTRSMWRMSRCLRASAASRSPTKAAWRSP